MTAPNGLEIENLHLLLNRREKTELVFLSPHPLRIMAAVSQAFITVPVRPYTAIKCLDN